MCGPSKLTLRLAASVSLNLTASGTKLEDAWVGSSCGDADAFRFQTPPVEPCMRFSRTWLTRDVRPEPARPIANNRDALSTAVLDDIARVHVSVPSAAWRVGENGPNGFHLSDAGIEWIEAVANAEMPQRAPER